MVVGLVYLCYSNLTEHQSLKTVFGSWKTRSELHQCYIPMDVRNVVDFGTMYERNFKEIRMIFPKISSECFS